MAESGGGGSSVGAVAATAAAVGLAVGAAVGGALVWSRVRGGGGERRGGGGGDKGREEARVLVGDAEEELMREQCKRNIQFLGAEEFERLRGKYVVVVGLGGTGSHAAHMLARSGVQHLRLVDFDQVTLSSLNRHAVATRADVGKAKVAVTRTHLLLTMPGLDCEAVQEIFTAERAEELLLEGVQGGPARRPDFVLDCIDNVQTKADLLAFCVGQGLPVLTCAGAGCRVDPTKLRISDISETSKDGLIRATRYHLNQRHRIRRGIPCLYSLEEPVKELLPLLDAAQEEDPSAFQTLPEIKMRVRIVPVLGPMPAIFGNALAMAVIAHFAGYDLTQKDVEKLPKRVYDKMLRALVQLENKHHGDEEGPSDDEKLGWGDVEYVVHDLFGGKSAFSRIGYNRTRLVVVRWDKSKRPSVENLVCLTAKEAERHYSLPGWEPWPQDFIDRVNQLLAGQRVA